MSRQHGPPADSSSIPTPSNAGLLKHVARIVSTDTAPMLEELREQYGRIVRIQMPTDDAATYLLADPTYVQQVLESNQANYRKAEIYRDELGKIFGRGLLTSEGDHWSRQHRLIRPMFTSDSVQSFTELIAEQTDAMCDRWQEHADRGEPIQLLPEMERVTLRIIGKAMFSTDMEGHAEDIAESLQVLRREFQRQTNRIRPTVPEWVPTPHNQQVKAARDQLNTVVYGLIEDRRGQADEYDDLLSALMAAREDETGERMDDEQIRDELMTFLLAGHETTAAALTWTWYLLVRNPEIHESLHASVDGHAGSEQGSPALGGDDPSYAKQCVQEAMRIYPPVPVFVREARKPDIIGGYEIPSGSEVLLSQYVVHRDPEYWEAPTEYRPERFTPGAAADRPAYSYFPFGGGPRMCIGRQFALLEAQMVLSRAVEQYRLELDSPAVEPGVDSAVTMVPDEPLEMQVDEW
ncbi:cytochrome P450 [Natronomonas salina]|uniref:cytochrome P450 n=1 Tax=Natronomonas salina TaxID=1710540 RepID=UPI0015B384BB|nr:cytochrome P450 [Natronomonas salina]QLD88200.1 cytochrome P450 [Natronomonas salina]